MTLTEFLTARLDEDEAVALRALAADGLDRPALHPTRRDMFMRVGGDGDRGGYHVDATPARVLAEVKAKRRIVAVYLDAHEVAVEMRSLYLGPGRTDVERAHYSARDSAYYSVLMHEAEIYADHPDYDEAWRP